MAYYGAVDVLDYGVEKKQKKDGEFETAMEASNANSPFAWVQGRAPRSPAEGGGAAATSYSPVPLSSPVGVDKAAMKLPGGLVERGALVTSPNDPGVKSFSAGNFGTAFSRPSQADMFKGAVQRQGVANENLKIGPQSMNDFDEEKKKRVGEFLDGYAPARGAAVSLGLG